MEHQTFRPAIVNIGGAQFAETAGRSLIKADALIRQMGLTHETEKYLEAELERVRRLRELQHSRLTEVLSDDGDTA